MCSLDSSSVECCYWIQNISDDILGIKYFSFTIHKIDDVTIVYIIDKTGDAYCHIVKTINMSMST